MHPKTIEHFLSRETANAYGVEHHRLRNTLQEVAMGSQALYALYTPTLLEASRFRTELAAALSQSKEHQAPTAKLWSHFLKGRVLVEFGPVVQRQRPTRKMVQRWRRPSALAELATSK